MKKKHHKKWKKIKRNNFVREIIKWVIIFVIVSLIVNFLIFPGTFTKFTSNINQNVPKIEIPNNISKIEIPNNIPQIEIQNLIRLVPSQMREYGVYKSLQRSCAQVEVIGESQGIYDMKKKVCREACGIRNREYSSYDCEIDLFVCYCK